MSNCQLLARVTTNMACAMPLARRLLFVTAALVSVAICAALPVSAESLSAKEKPLYIGDFGPSYVMSNGEFLLPNDSRVQWTIRSFQRAGTDSSASQSSCLYGVGSYRSYDQLNKRPRLLNLNRGYKPGSILQSPLLNGAGVEQRPVGDYGPRPNR